MSDVVVPKALCGCQLIRVAFLVLPARTFMESLSDSICVELLYSKDSFQPRLVGSQGLTPACRIVSSHLCCKILQHAI